MKVKKENPGLKQIQAITGLCNSADFDTDSQSTPLIDRHIFGDATDQAALRFSESLGSISELRAHWSLVFELAFDSKNKFMARAFTISEPNGFATCLPAREAENFKPGSMYVCDQEAVCHFFEFWEMLTASSLLTVKGAPDILIERCTNIVLPDGNVIPLTEDGCSAVRQLKDQWSSEGKRVILLARKILHEDEESIVPADPETKILNEIRNGLTLVGLISIIDPPRPEIPGVVSTLRRAGIRVFMVRLGPSKGTPFIWRSCFDRYHRLLAIME